MARKLFGMIEAGAAGVVDQGAAKPEAGASRTPGGRMMSLNRLSTGLMDLSNNSVRDIDLDAIDASDVRDRLSLDDEGIAALAEAIKTHGQIVPVLVRPLPDHPDRYQIVYGRRRLAAIRALGLQSTIKAIVRNVKDEEAIVAQGQENNLRLDPSYIEKALFARALQQQGYDITIISQALNIDRYEVSKYIKAADDSSDEIIALIGAAHGIGRRPWRELGDLVLAAKGKALTLIQAALAAQDQSTDSKQRFELALQSLKAGPEIKPKAKVSDHGPKNRLVGSQGPAPQLSFRTTAKQLALTIERRDDPAFTAWLEENIDQIVSNIQQDWISTRQE